MSQSSTAGTWRSAADMGGLPGLGAIDPPPEEVLFHDAWERKALALTLAIGATGSWTIDHARAARESLPRYSSNSYYQTWLDALDVLMQERGLASATELATGISEAPSVKLPRTLFASDVAAALARGSSAARTPQATAKFSVGMAVKTSMVMPRGHTRLPVYARGKKGVIAAIRGCHVFPDRHSARPTAPFDDRPEWLYTVVFDSTELWGIGAEAGNHVSIDAWEPYLESA